ncbi:GPP34 family phosphoprotein [Micromonospora coxensis]|uniref:GPP34 family phosphoprotein n=1 Tax=Micromonospora coxensis TaxID=356852 RepID=UPI0038CC0AA7
MGGHPPSDDLLSPAGDYLSAKPRGVQTALVAVGPPLREPVWDRLIARGDIDQEPHTVLGLFRTTALPEGGTGRRARLSPTSGRSSWTVRSRRPASPCSRHCSPRAAPPQFHRGIPWTPSVTGTAAVARVGDHPGPNRHGRYVVDGVMSSSATQRATPAG